MLSDLQNCGLEQRTLSNNTDFVVHKTLGVLQFVRLFLRTGRMAHEGVYRNVRNSKYRLAAEHTLLDDRLDGFRVVVIIYLWIC